MELLGEDGVLQEFDEVQDEGLRRLAPDLTPLGLDQAMRATNLAGAGMRRANEVAAPAHLGSLVNSVPKLGDLAGACDLAGLSPADDVLEEVNLLMHEARQHIAGKLDPGCVALLD